MPLNNTNIPNASADLVGIFSQSFRQFFPLARPVKALVDETAKAMEHPLETGSVTTDHIIFQPNEIEISVILPAGEYRSVYQQIEQIYKAATILSVQTKAATYNNMFIYRLPHQEDPDLFDTIAMNIRMRQALFIETLSQVLPPQAVQNPANQSTVNNGLQQPGGTQSLPGPEVFGPLNENGLRRLENNTGVSPPAPNAEGYSIYDQEIVKGTGVYPLTPEQTKQLLEATQ